MESPQQQQLPQQVANNLIVNYIPQNMTDDQLRHLFMPFGNIESARIVKEKGTQRSMGYGFVKFLTDAEASNAIQALNGRQIENKTLKVAVAKPPGSEKLCNLYIAGLEAHITKDDLTTLFQAYGPITEVKILNDKGTGVSRGVGFVKFEYPEHATKATEALNGVTLAGTSKPLAVRVAEKKDTPPAPMMPFAAGRNVRYNPMAFFPQQGFQMAPGFGAPAFPGFQMTAPPQVASNIPSFCLFVYNLPPESDENYLYQLFGPYGAVAQVRINRDPATSLCKGFGFVNMVKFEDAQSAINALHGAQIGTKTLQVSFKKDK